MAALASVSLVAPTDTTGFMVAFLAALIGVGALACTWWLAPRGVPAADAPRFLH